MAPRKPRPWAPPAGLKIEIAVSRGDAVFRSEASVGDAMNIARLLTAMARQITAEAPDLLSTVEQVGGNVMGYDWAEEFADGGRKQTKPPRIGYTL